MTLQHALLAIDGEAAERAPVALADAAVGDRGLDPGARSSRRSVLATVERARPTRSATRSWVNPNSSISWRYASASSIGSRSSRWRFSTSASSSWSRSASWRTTAGIRSRPAASGRADAALAGDELVAVERLGDEDRLEHAVLADARGELLEPPRRSAGAAGTGSDGSDRAAISTGPAGRRAAAGSATARPRPEAAGVRSGRTVMQSPRSGGIADGDGAGAAPHVGRRDAARRNSRASRGRRRRPRSRGGRARSAGRGSAPRRGGRCAG